MGVQNLKKNVKGNALLRRVIPFKGKENGDLLLHEKIEGYTSYSLIINNIKYPITKDFFIKEDQIGDSFEIDVRPNGRALERKNIIRIEKKGNSNNSNSVIEVTIDNIYFSGDINDAKT